MALSHPKPAKKHAQKKRPAARAPRSIPAIDDPPAGTDLAAGAAAEFPWITEQLRPFAVPMGDIAPDPRNARGHDEPNIKSIQGSLRRFGQLQPLVVNRATKLIAAGNGRYVAAQRLRWTHIAVVYVDQDAQSHAGYALADNRTAELAEWIQTAVLEEIAMLQTHDRDLAEELLLDELRADCLPKKAKTGTKGKEAAIASGEAMWQILITCRDEAHQLELLARFEADGLNTRALVV